MNLWTILIPTIGQRQDRFAELMEVLLPQVEEYRGQVRVLAYYNNGEQPLGEIRQALVEKADSLYVSFIDDDDMVPPYYVDEVYQAILVGAELPDYVGWQMQHYDNGVPSKPTFHSLEYEQWWDDANGYYRDISHLNPVKRSLALAHGDFRKGYPEDVDWATQMRGHLLTQVYIQKVMYHYRASSDSTWRGGLTPGDYKLADISSFYFDWMFT